VFIYYEELGKYFLSACLIKTSCLFLFFLWRWGPTRAMASSFLRFLDHTQQRTTVGRIPLDQWSARRRDLYLTTHNTRNRQTVIPPVRFELTISAGERPQTYAVDRKATRTGYIVSLVFELWPAHWHLKVEGPRYIDRAMVVRIIIRFSIVIWYEWLDETRPGFELWMIFIEFIFSLQNRPYFSLYFSTV
jgi:hypothetical protein